MARSRQVAIAGSQSDGYVDSVGGWNLKRNDVGGIIVTTAQLYELALEIGILVDDASCASLQAW